MSQKGKGGAKTKSLSMTKRKKNYESKKIYVPKINSPYGVSSSNSKAKNARSLASVNKTRNEKSSVEANVTLINHKNGKKATSKSPKNLNDIKRINNNKVVCNNVMIDVEGCYDPMIKLDDITESEFSMNDVENSVVGWIVKHGRGKTILGCMAWLSNKKILNCLIENAKRVLFLVNDEDYSNWPKVLRYYDRLPKFEEPLHSAFFGSKSLLRALDRDSLGNRWEVCSFEPVRCFGNSAFASKRAASLMHNKIIIFFEETRLPGGKIVETPVSFITGSYNCTDNASNNLENAVFLKSKKGAEHCFYQFSIIMSHSRPLRRS